MTYQELLYFRFNNLFAFSYDDDDSWGEADGYEEDETEEESDW